LTLGVNEVVDVLAQCGNEPISLGVREPYQA
jgi:hypothetical protein